MKNIIITIVFLLILQANGMGQDETELVSDPQARPYLEKLSERFSMDNAFQVEFRYVIHSTMEDTRVTDYGSIIIKKDQYKLKTDDAEIYYDGTQLWSYNTQAGEVYLSEPSEENVDQLLADPFRLLAAYEEYFKFRLREETTISEENYQVIDLYPKNRNLNYSILRLRINGNGSELHSLLVKQKNGIDIEIFINELITNLKVPDATFVWDKEAHPDIPVIEL